MFRTFAGNMEVYREGVVRDNSSPYIQAAALSPTAGAQAVNELNPTASLSGSVAPRTVLCNCIGAGESSHRHSCFYSSHSDQHATEDLLIRSASFDTSVASISSNTTMLAVVQLFQKLEATCSSYPWML